VNYSTEYLTLLILKLSQLLNYYSEKFACLIS
jgi:hypothetical protein